MHVKNKEQTDIFKPSGFTSFTPAAHAAADRLDKTGLYTYESYFWWHSSQRNMKCLRIGIWAFKISFLISERLTLTIWFFRLIKCFLRTLSIIWFLGWPFLCAACSSLVFLHISHLFSNSLFIFLVLFWISFLILGPRKVWNSSIVQINLDMYPYLVLWAIFLGLPGSLPLLFSLIKWEQTIHQTMWILFRPVFFST